MVACSENSKAIKNLQAITMSIFISTFEMNKCRNRIHLLDTSTIRSIKSNTHLLVWFSETITNFEVSNIRFECKQDWNALFKFHLSNCEELAWSWTQKWKRIFEMIFVWNCWNLSLENIFCFGKSEYQLLRYD